MSKDKSAAVLTIFNASAMSYKGRHDIALWLRRQARFLTSFGKKMSPRFTARYLYRKGK